MPVAPSFDDLLAQFEAEAQLVRPSLQFRDGDITVAQQHGAGAMADATIRYAAQGFKQTFIDGAEGDDLTALVDDHLNIQRQAATAAQVDVTFTRTGSAAGTTPSGFTVGSAYDASGNSVTFTTNSPITWGAADHGPHIVTCTAAVLSRAGNVSPATVTRIVDSPLPDTSIACTNATFGAGGNDAESDPELRVRARNFWLTLRRGTLAALEEGALEVPAVRVARATEDITTGYVTLVVADSDGNSTAQMISDVETIEEAWRSAGVNVNVLGGTQLPVNFTATMVFRSGSGANSQIYAPLVQTAVVGRLAKYAQGEIVYLDSLKAAAIAVDPDVIEALLFALNGDGSPFADIAPTVTQTPRSGTITIQ